MAKTEKKVAAAQESNTGQGALLVEAIKGAISSGLAPLVTELKAASDGMNSLRNDVEELKGLHLIQAAAKREEEDDEEMSAGKEEDDEEMSAGKEEDDEEAASDDDPSDKKSKDDSSDDESDGDDDDLDAMEDLEKKAADEEPGEVNEDAENKGDKSTVTKPPKQGASFSDNIAEGRLKSSGLKAKGSKLFPNLKSSSSIKAAAVMIEGLQAQVHKLHKMNHKLNNQLMAQNAEFKKQMKKLGNKYSAMEAQAEKWADQVDRRSSTVVSTDLRNMMAKVNVDPHEIMAGNAEPLTVQAADQMFKVLAESGIQIEPTQRAAYKNRMRELGLMESGEVPYTGRTN